MHGICSNCDCQTKNTVKKYSASFDIKHTIAHHLIPGVPSPPGQPVIELSSNRSAGAAAAAAATASNDGDVDEASSSSVTDEINISWDVPKDDGGFPITGYRVEMLDIQVRMEIYQLEKNASERYT